MFHDTLLLSNFLRYMTTLKSGTIAGSHKSHYCLQLLLNNGHIYLYFSIQYTHIPHIKVLDVVTCGETDDSLLTHLILGLDPNNRDALDHSHHQREYQLYLYFSIQYTHIPPIKVLDVVTCGETDDSLLTHLILGLDPNNRDALDHSHHQREYQL